MSVKPVNGENDGAPTVSIARIRWLGNGLGLLAVVAAAASSLFGLPPINSAANSYALEGWIVTSAWLAIGTGLISFAAWMMILATRDVYANQMAACAAMALVIVVLAALPAILASGDYAPETLAAPPLPTVEVVAGLSSIASLIAGLVGYLVVRLLNGRRRNMLIGVVGGVLVWGGYVSFIHPF